MLLKMNGEMKMEEKVQLFTSEKRTIKSTELVEIINQFRLLESEASGKKYTELRHNDFMTKIKKEVETLKTLGLEGQRNFSQSSYINSQNKEQPCFELNVSGMRMMLNSESTVVRFKTEEYIEKLEKQLDPVQNYLSMSEEDRAILYFTKVKESKQLEAENKKKDELLLIAGEKTTIVNEFLESKGLYGVDSVAKTLAIKGMGRNNLYDYLRQNKIIMTDTYLDKHDKKKAGAKHYEAYSQYVNQQQYFAHRSRTVQAGFKTIEQLVAMFTPKGIEWIIKRLQKDGYIPTKDLKTIIEELTPVV
jgi:phage antirepressor YoqD-like protein